MSRRGLVMPVVLIALLAALVPISNAGAQTTPPAAFDYTDVAGLSQPTYETTRESYNVEMHDGVELYVEVVRPNAQGQFPVVLEASPYHGTLADRDGTRILPEPRDADGRSLGLTGYFAPRGYAVVMVDLRGTGRSGGCLDHLGPNDAKDLKTIVEWAADRTWSNGKVGMTGHSYVGSTPMVAAAQNPDGLATIVPSAGLAGMYHHQFQAGVPYFLQWMGVMWSYPMLSTNRHLPPQIPAIALGGANGDDFGQDMETFGCGWQASSLASGEPQLSGQYTWWHGERDHEAGATAAKIPVFLIHGVNDNAARVPAAQWFFDRNGGYTASGQPATATHPGQDKLWLGQWDHGSGCCPNRRGIQWTYALHAWFDKWLKGNAVDTGPAVEVFMADGTLAEVQAGARTEILTTDRFSASAQMVDFFPAAAGRTLRDTSPWASGSVSFTGDPLGFSAPKSTGGATFTSQPMTDDMVIAGVPKLKLSASVTVPRVHLITNVFDESPNGTWRRIGQFTINPELRSGLATPKPVVAAQRYDMKPPGFAMGHHLREGHRLVLRVSTSDPDKVPTFAVDPLVTVFTGPNATRLTLPVVPSPQLVADDVPLVLEGGSVPLGPAQPSTTGSVTTLASGAGTREPGVTSQYVEFDVQAGFDNARMVATAIPAQPADIDLYLQRQRLDGSWGGDMRSGTSGSLTEEVVTADRLHPGHYRIEVHNWSGPPANQVDMTIDFFNQAGEKGS
ncbi:MAG TPA: CocE/NonD family hydrolase [Actinomycetota bacterium]|nr:CocE/NonD family hydrolase [Actinomycetota bacterium]